MERKFPLFIITGASGVGKTTVMHELRGLFSDFVVLSTDNDNFGSSKLDYQDRYNLLMHFAAAAMKSNIGTIICGTIMPWDAQKCDTYHDFSEVCFINLHCDDDTRNHRLRNRHDKDTWTDEMLKAHQEFAQWLLNNAETAYDPPMPTIDTTLSEPAEIALQIREIIAAKWNN